MRIYTMHATFGKLENQTLTLQPGLNVIQASNEWGKSTWCAFLLAMFYGMDTRQHSTKTALADKERYTPWSGSLMSGRIDLCWQGRDITVERRTRGRIPFGEFRCYETQSGISVPEITSENCGQLLLGVERSVFMRSGFIRLSDLPVSQDEALRRRLNALVTTGDETAAADRLASQLRELKNKCRYYSRGLIPLAQLRRDAMEKELEKLHALQGKHTETQIALEAAQAELAQLQNHEAALAYTRFQEQSAQLQIQKEACAQLENQLEVERMQAGDLPSASETEQKLQQAHALQKQLADLEESCRRLEELPWAQPMEVFADCTPEEAFAMAEKDTAAWEKSRKKGLPMLLGLLTVLLAAAGVLLWLKQMAMAAYACWGTAAVAAMALCILLAVRMGRRKALRKKYQAPHPALWKIMAEEFAQAQLDAEDRQEKLDSLQAEKMEASARLEALIQGREDALAHWQSVLSVHNRLSALEQELRRSRSYCKSLEAMLLPAPRPEETDALTLTREETRYRLSQITTECNRLQLLLGQALGQMTQLEDEQVLIEKLKQLNLRIQKLEAYEQALQLCQETLKEATLQLQRRFAPRISRRAQTLLGKLTGQRYNRLVLGEDFSLSAATQEEGTLHDAKWRSDGTVDQLYLALRLAVSQELTPQAPLVLDDALVRFDDARLAAAMEILQELGQEKQILLFTCHTRESANLKA